MGFTKSTADLNIISALSDLPNADDGLTAEQLKAKFDTAGNQLQDDLNGLIDELENIAASSKLGAAPVYDGDESDDDLQAKLEMIYQAIIGSSQGQVPDRSITELKLTTELLNALGRRNGELQTGLNAEMIGGEDLDGISVIATNVAQNVANFKLAEIIATENCQELTITGLNITANTDFLIRYTSNADSADITYYKVNDDSISIGEEKDTLTYASLTTNKLHLLNSDNYKYIKDFTDTITSITIRKRTATGIKAGDKFTIYKLTY